MHEASETLDAGMKTAQGEDTQRGGMTRRSFLGTAAAATGALALGGCSAGATAANTNAADEIPEDEIFCNTCRTNCSNMCYWDVHVRDGVVVDMTSHRYDDDPDEHWRHGCPRVYLNIQNMYDAERILHPMKRVGERGAGQWEQITWDEAIDTIASTWTKILDEVGGAGLGFWSIAGCWSVLNGSVMHTGVWDRFRSILDANRLFDSADWGGMYIWQQMTKGSSWGWDNLSKAENVVIWCNPVETYQNSLRRINEARANGAKVTCIDPMFTASAAISDEFIGIKPATDAALALAAVKYIVDHDMHDKPFLRKMSMAPFLIRDDNGFYLRKSDFDSTIEPDSDDDSFVVWNEVAGKAEYVNDVTNTEQLALTGAYTVESVACKTAFDLLVDSIQPYTMEYAEEITGVPQRQIIDLAEGYATKKTFTLTYLGACHYMNGPQLYMAMITLMIVTGSMGREGTGDGYNYANGLVWNQTYAHPGRADEVNAGIGAPIVSAVKVPGDKSGSAYDRGFSEMDFPEVMETGMYNGKELPLRSVVAWCGNVIGGGCEPQKFIEALDKLELFIVPATRMNDTARNADIILPLTHWFECEDVSCNHKSPYARYLEKCVEPPEDCRTDFEIVGMIAEKMGLGQYFQDSVEDALRKIVDSEGNAKSGITFDALKEKKCIRHIKDDFVGPEDGVYSTQTKRLQFYFEDMKPRFPREGSSYDPNDYKLPSHAHIGEVLADEKARESYPLAFLSPHSKYSSQTTLSDQPWMMELWESPKLHINPADAEARGIKDGDLVRAFNDRGECVFTAKLNDGIHPGVTLHYHGMRKKNFVKGHYEELTSARYDWLTHNTCYNDTLIQIEKYEEA